MEPHSPSSLLSAFRPSLITRWKERLSVIGRFEPSLESLREDQLRKQSLSLRYRAKSGESLDALLPEAFALVREAAQRTLNMRHYDVQLLGGMAMHFRAIAEMQTGEGKTLTATLPLYLASLSGQGAHLATANDYLASRDAELMRPVYEMLGISLGVIQSQTTPTERREAYTRDITYGTAKEFGFDFLRDRLAVRSRVEQHDDLLGRMLDTSSTSETNAPVQRGLHFLLADEADSLLLDEARTPLVISAPASATQRATADVFRWASEVVEEFVQDEHFRYNTERRSIELTDVGRRQARELPQEDSMRDVGMFTIHDFLERAILVYHRMVRDRQYMVRDEEIVIVDEATGRMAEGRRFSRGIHQAIEAKEGLAISLDTSQAARITAQDFFLSYERLAGMTGTAASSSSELARIYRTKVIAIPTNRPPIRQCLPERLLRTANEKWAAIAEEVAQVHATGRPVLIGTRSIDKSETLSRFLSEEQIEHEVLNAKQLDREAEIVSQAGQEGRVTVSTNMAGRGTDIRLGPGIEEIGGLHVICSELHESRRIDRQLIGRCGRQGDSGTFRQYLSLEDDILREGLGEKAAGKIREAASPERGVRLLRRAQLRAERQHFRDRKMLMYHERQRRKLQEELGLDPYLDTPE